MILSQENEHYIECNNPLVTMFIRKKLQVPWSFKVECSVERNVPSHDGTLVEMSTWVIWGQALRRVFGPSRDGTSMLDEYFDQLKSSTP